MHKLRVLKLHPGTKRSGMMEAHLSTAIAKLPELRHLDVMMYLGGVGAAAVANALKDAYALVSLTLSSRELGGEGCKALAAGLHGEQHPNLTHLNLSCNTVGQEGVVALASLITIFPRMQRLNLRCLRQSDVLGDEVELGWGDSIAPLAYAAATLPCLEEFDVSGNDALEKGARALARLMTTSTSLRSLGISRCIKSDVSLQSVFMEELRHADGSSILQELHAEASLPTVSADSRVDRYSVNPG